MNWLLAIAFIFYLTPATAQEWQQFGNDDFGYVFDVPPDYELTDQFGNEGSDGAVFKSVADDGIITVWGIELPNDDLGVKVKQQIKLYEDEGWEFSHKQLHERWAAYSGVKEGRIRYIKAITICGDRAAFFMMDYDRDLKSEYTPIVTRMEKSMRREGC